MPGFRTFKAKPPTVRLYSFPNFSPALPVYTQNESQTWNNSVDCCGIKNKIADIHSTIRKKLNWNGCLKNIVIYAIIKLLMTIRLTPPFPLVV